MTLTESSLFGIRVCASTPALAAQAVHAHAQRSSGVVCVANVDMVTRAVNDSRLAQVMARAFAVVTDGMPLVWALKKRGLVFAQRVYGPQLTRDLCALAAQTGMPVFFYGGTPQELALLQSTLLKAHPQLQIAGAISPPLLAAEPPLDEATAQLISSSGARLVFVGLGCPKQEYWMQIHGPQINATMVGVGLAFAQIAGLKRAAPAWMQQRGLEWLFRLAQEPKRLWRRYLLGNSRFVWYLGRDLLRSLWRGRPA
jgi:N-acetylglucosaminyldiphosphoundecaprenol N-acetyl-beta-D-mannosaminyltransferase